MDLRKAFDTVSHKILLCKLHHYGIRGPAYASIKNYLTSRNQFVTFSNTSSSTKPIKIGVFQDSILVPLLFLIYINGLPNAINSTPRLFAVDTCLILRQSSLSALEKACSDELIQCGVSGIGTQLTFKLLLLKRGTTSNEQTKITVKLRNEEVSRIFA